MIISATVPLLAPFFSMNISKKYTKSIAINAMNINISCFLIPFLLFPHINDSIIDANAKIAIVASLICIEILAVPTSLLRAAMSPSRSINRRNRKSLFLAESDRYLLSGTFSLLQQADSG
jgi:hypothetical protein